MGGRRRSSRCTRCSRTSWPSRGPSIASRSWPRRCRRSKLYARLAEMALVLVRGDWTDGTARGRARRSRRRGASSDGRRSIGFHATGFNERGRYAEAKAACESALAHVTDADREYVALFLVLDIQMAIAEAGLGNVEAGLARIDGLLARFADSDHPLVQGSLHEARARIAWMAGRADEYNVSLAVVERWFRPTGTPGLIAKWERLAELKGPRRVARGRAPRPIQAPWPIRAITTGDERRLDRPGTETPGR